MVFSIINLALTVPVLATTTMQIQDDSQKKKDDSDAEIKTDKCHLTARVSSRMSAAYQEKIGGKRLVLREGRLWLENPQTTKCHPFSGYFLPYPERGYDGLVSTINAENMLNWVFVDKDTYQLRYGIRVESAPHLTGPMTLSYSDEKEEWRVAFEGWEGFVAVQEDDNTWAVYFDKNDNGLVDQGHKGSVVEIELVRSPLESRTPSDSGEGGSDKS